MTKAANKADRKPTWTALVFDALVNADDFLDMSALCSITRGSPNQISAALFHLTKRRAVEAVEGAGRLWWMATPADDSRVRTVDARVPELPGNRHRGRRHKLNKPDER